MSKLNLTKMGEFANAHGVLTEVSWWLKIKCDIDRIADEDGDWKMMLDERIRGLQELKARYYEISNE